MNKIKKIAVFIVLLFVLLGYTNMTKANIFTYLCHSSAEFGCCNWTSNWVEFLTRSQSFGSSFSTPSSYVTIMQGNITGYIKDQKNKETISTSTKAIGHIDFDTLNHAQNSNIKPKEFKIIKPVNGEQFETGTNSIEIECAYGGNIEDDFLNADKHKVSGTIKYEGMGDAGEFDINNYMINDGITYWITTATLTKSNNGTYQVYISLWTDTMRGGDTVTIVIGKANGNPLIDFLNRLWGKFEEWFIKTMKYLFIPTNQQMQGLANSAVYIQLIRF